MSGTRVEESAEKEWHPGYYRLPEELYQRVRRLAFAREVSASSLAVRAFEEFLERQEDSPSPGKD